jgi:hypothetical protein
VRAVSRCRKKDSLREIGLDSPAVWKYNRRADGV